MACPVRGCTVSRACKILVGAPLLCYSPDFLPLLLLRTKPKENEKKSKEKRNNRTQYTMQAAKS